MDIMDTSEYNYSVDKMMEGLSDQWKELSENKDAAAAVAENERLNKIAHLKSRIKYTKNYIEKQKLQRELNALTMRKKK